MQPTETELETIKSICRKFIMNGFLVYFGIAPQEYGSNAIVRISNDFKQWHFCDPDWRVVIKQLDKLSQKLEIIT